MPIHFNPDGIVSVDSVDEAIRFEQLRNKESKPKKPGRQKLSRRNPKLQGWDGFVEFLNGPNNATARKILALVQGAPDGIDRHLLAHRLEIDVQVVIGTLTGIKKKASACSLDSNELILKDDGGKYRPGKLLAQHGAPMP